MCTFAVQAISRLQAHGRSVVNKVLISLFLELSQSLNTKTSI